MQLWVVMYKNLHAIEDIFRHKTLKVKKMKTVELIMGFRFCLNTLWVYRSLNLYKTAAIRFLYFLSKHTWSVIHTTSDTMSTSSYYIRLPNNIFTCKYDVLKLTLCVTELHIHFWYQWKIKYDFIPIVILIQVQTDIILLSISTAYNVKMHDRFTFQGNRSIVLYIKKVVPSWNNRNKYIQKFFMQRMCVEFVYI